MRRKQRFLAHGTPHMVKAGTAQALITQLPQTVTRRLRAWPLSGAVTGWLLPAGLVWLSSQWVISVTASRSVFDSGRISGMAAGR